MKPLMMALLLIGSQIASCGEIADYYAKLPPKLKPSGPDDAWSTNHGITEIGIEHTPCFGPCPIYTAIFKSDGTFRYTGVSGVGVTRVGDFTGTVPVSYFHELAQFVRDSGYMNLKDGYRRDITDFPTTYTTVVMNGKRKTVMNHANAGPTKLWAIERLTDDLLGVARWNASPKTKNNK